MNPKTALILIISILTLGLSLGCSMCCGPYDYDYPTYGGQHERMDRTYGRIGSTFSDPMAISGTESADGNRELPESRTTTESETEADAEADLEKFKQELESISPKKKNPATQGLNDLEELPEPETSKDPTANRPRRSQWQWR